MDNEELLTERHLREIRRLNTIRKHIDNGVRFEGIDNIYIDDDVIIGSGTVIENDNRLLGNTVIGSDVIIAHGNTVKDSRIGGGCAIRQSVLTDCEIGGNTTIGVFAHIHSGSIIGKACRIGNFVEIKNSKIGSNNKMAHLAYIGDVDMQNHCNVGCGAIFVNYDGKNKHRSVVGNSVFIGSNCNIIAPVELEDNAYIAAGTTVTQSLPSNCMCIGRNREVIKENKSKYNKNLPRKYFGTDGIRGVYGEFLTDKIAYSCGNFLGYSADGGMVVIGRDTRVSGEALAREVMNGCIDAGTAVIDLGIVPTPVVSYITKHLGANYGVVISASHNPPEFNGLKIFNSYGRKLQATEESEIEQHIEFDTPVKRSVKGKIEKHEKYIELYNEAILQYIGRLDGMRIAIDCANGASFANAAKLFTAAGALVDCFCTNNDGTIINCNCGATNPKMLAEQVRKNSYDAAFCFDGDADRVIAIDENGDIIDGDGMLYIIAEYLQGNNKLKDNTVVATTLSNTGLKNALEQLNITLVRTDVGDHNVAARMAADNIVIGGEQSGHIIINEFSETGDGVLVALFLTRIIKEKGLKFSLLNKVNKYPQTDLNYKSEFAKQIVGDSILQKEIADIKSEINDNGRVNVRASGTEPLLRISVECGNKRECDIYAQRLYDIVNNINIEIYKKLD